MTQKSVGEPGLDRRFPRPRVSSVESIQFSRLAQRQREAGSALRPKSGASHTQKRLTCRHSGMGAQDIGRLLGGAWTVRGSVSAPVVFLGSQMRSCPGSGRVQIWQEVGWPFLGVLYF